MKPSPGQLPLEQPGPYPMAAWDMEIATELPDDRSAWREYRPFGVACGAIAIETSPTDFLVEFFTDRRPDVAGRLLGRLGEIAETHTIVGWNSLGFDFDVLAEETGRIEECARLALDHIDLMQLVVVTKGYRKGLDSACVGMGIEGKAHAVELNDGSVLESMGGGQAPGLWNAGEHNAVLAYLREDVRATLDVGRAARASLSLQWVTGRGRSMSSALPKLYTVRECLGLRMPYQGFLDPPWPSPHEAFEWAKGIHYGLGAGNDEG